MKYFSEEHRRKLSLAKKGKKTGPMREEIKKKISETHKGKVLSEETKKRMSIAKTGTKHSKETKEKMRVSALKENLEPKTIEKMRVSANKNRERIGIYGPNIGINETEILDNIEQEKNVKLSRQYPVIGYYLDGYDEENNVVYEVDEVYHKGKVYKDSVRKMNIINHLQCEWYTIIDY